MTLSSDITNGSILNARNLLNKGEITSVELTQHFIDKTSANPYNAFITLTPELALAQAKKADENYKNKTPGLVEGIPMAIKDLFCTNGIRTTAGSKILHNFVPRYESTVTQLLYAHGAVCLGKTNMDEFAMGSANITSYFGPVINPWKSKTEPNKDLVPGGSSGGSATAVAGHLAMGSLGSDTGGSIRQPASFCGIVGIKPSYGRCSRYGMVAFSSSLDRAGTFGRSVADATLILQSICGYDPKDSTSYNISTPDWINLLKYDIRGMKIGVPKEYRVAGMKDDIIASWEEGLGWLKAQGAEIIEVSLPHTDYALPVYYTIAPAEASSNLARYDGVRYGLRVDGDSAIDMIVKTRTDGFGAEVKRRIMIGTYVLSAAAYGAYYVKAQQIRRLISNDFKEVFKQVDVLVTPTTPSAAFGLHENQNDPIQMYMNDLFTIPASLAGLPTISVPTRLNSDGLPLSLQVIGKNFDETAILRIATALELAANFPTK